MYYDYTYSRASRLPRVLQPPLLHGFSAASLTDVLTRPDVDFQYHFRLGERHQVIWVSGYPGNPTKWTKNVSGRALLSARA